MCITKVPRIPAVPSSSELGDVGRSLSVSVPANHIAYRSALWATSALMGREDYGRPREIGSCGDRGLRPSLAGRDETGGKKRLRRSRRDA